MLKKLTIPLLFLMFDMAYAQESALTDSQFTIDTKNEQITIVSKYHGSFTLDLSILPVVDNNYVELTPVHIIKNKNRVYLLMSFLFPSRPGASRGRCAAGDENYLLWLEYDNKHKLKNSQFEAYNSCLLSLENQNPVSIGYADKLNGLAIRIFDLMSDREYQLIYDLKQPEKGLKKRDTGNTY